MTSAAVLHTDEKPRRRRRGFCSTTKVGDVLLGDVLCTVAAPGKVGPLWLRQPSGIVSAKFRVLTFYLMDAGQSTSSKADGRANMQIGSEQPTSKTAFFDPDRPRLTPLGGRACILEAHLISG